MCLWRLVVDGIVLLVSVISVGDHNWRRKPDDVWEQLVLLSY